MANTSYNQRAQFDRVDLSVPTTGVRVRRRRPLIIYTVIALAILGALSYATIEAINGWAQGVVLAMIVVTTVGMMIAINPLRRA
jgi:fatty acid desaturase